MAKKILKPEPKKELPKVEKPKPQKDEPGITHPHNPKDGESNGRPLRYI